MTMSVATLPADMGSNNSLMISEDLCEQLIPGLPDSLVLEMICPNLSWRDFYILSSVSPQWEQAIRAHRVYDARVRHNSTEALIATVNCHISGHCSNHDFHTIVLYSKVDEVGYELPPIPDLPAGIPYFCQCVSLEGKLYCLGGIKDMGHFCGSMEVYVLDLAGQRQWKQCASMRKGRENFGVGVMDGKIYVFGGSSGLSPVQGSEVYDPQVNAWSDIKPMPSFRHKHHVVVMGEELFVHGGELLHTYVLDRAENRLIDLDEHLEDENLEDEHDDSEDDADEDADDEDSADDDDDEDNYEDADDEDNADDDDDEDNYEDADEDNDEDEEQQGLGVWERDPTFTEVYLPGKDEWRLIDKFGKSLWGGLFVAQGQFHVMTSSRNKVGIYVQKPDTLSWALQHESAVVELGRANSTKTFLRGVVAVDGEILAGVAWYNLSRDVNGPALLQSDGYSSDRKIVWKVIAKGTLSGAHFDHCPWAASARFFLCPIEL